MSNNFFSVIVPCYNAGKTLKRCIDSIVRQTFSDFELILVDDGSNDDSVNIMMGFASKNNSIKIIKHDTNKGIIQARDTGLINSSGLYIVWVDADDYIEICRLEKMHQYIISHDYVDVVCTGKTVIKGSEP